MSLTTKQKLTLFFGPVLLRIYQAYWRICKPKKFGVKGIIEHEGEYLFIQNTYGFKRWTMPGGGIEKGESPEEAVLREVKEEVGLDTEIVSKVGIHVSTAEGKIDTIHIFLLKSDTGDAIKDEFEIADMQWSSNLPEGASPVAKIIWEMFGEKKGNF